MRATAREAGSSQKAGQRRIGHLRARKVTPSSASPLTASVPGLRLRAARLTRRSERRPARCASPPSVIFVVLRSSSSRRLRSSRFCSPESVTAVRAERALVVAPSRNGARSPSLTSLLNRRSASIRPTAAMFSTRPRRCGHNRLESSEPSQLFEARQVIVPDIGGAQRKPFEPRNAARCWAAALPK